MVTAADMVNVQQQLMQEVAEVMRQVRAELSETANGRIDVSNGFATPLKRVSGNPAASMPDRISDLLPKNWEGGNEEGLFMSDLHLCKRGLVKGRRCLSAWTAPTSSTASHLQ